MNGCVYVNTQTHRYQQEETKCTDFSLVEEVKPKATFLSIPPAQQSRQYEQACLKRSQVSQELSKFL